MDEKEKREWDVINLLYPKDSKYTIIKDERPDFVVIDGKKRFGVEITELYSNPLRARIKNDDDYRSNLLKLEGATKNERNIAKRIGGVKIQYLQDCESGDYHEIRRMVNYQMLDKEKLIDAFIQAIYKKEIAYKQYRKDLDYIELLVRDKDFFFDDCTDLSSNEVFAVDKKELWDALEALSFRRVILISEIRGRLIHFAFGDLD